MTQEGPGTIGTGAQQIGGNQDLTHSLPDPADLRVALIDPDPQQPRQWVDPEKLAELAASIDANGQATPVMVRPAGDRYVIVHGERRWRAVRSLGWETIRAEVADADEATARWLQLAENLGRADLSPLEEARAYRSLLDTGVSRDTLAGQLGKSGSYVRQKLRLLDLPAPVAYLLDRGGLSEGHVRQLLRIKALYTDEHVVESGRTDPDKGARSMMQWPVADRVAVVSVMGRMLRPLDWPTGYPAFPFRLDADKPGHVLASDALIELGEELATTGPSYPRWSLTAAYFAGLTVAVELPVATLHTVIDQWIESIHSAVVSVSVFGTDEPDPDQFAREWLCWWGYRSDLRHAGLLDDHDHLIDAACETTDATDTIALPSECQPGGPKHDAYQADSVSEAGGQHA